MGAAVLLAICAALAPPVLAQGSVPGRLTYQPQQGFSTAIVGGSFAYLSGVPASGGQNIDTAVVQVLNSLNQSLVALGGTLENAVRTNVILADIRQFAAMNDAYTPFFPSSPPARSSFVATNPGSGSQIEIDLVAYLPKGPQASA